MINFDILSDMVVYATFLKFCTSKDVY